ncbi:MAG TPA: hypothetical protein VHA74_02770 [Candidatus Dojkabacteria bacterium]|nr:hypothetical protein [Candidatus Dojkabacteria bacterium]
MTKRQGIEIQENQRAEFLEWIEITLAGRDSLGNFYSNFESALNDINASHKSIDLHFKEGSRREMIEYAKYLIQYSDFQNLNFRVFDLNQAGLNPIGELVGYDDQSKQTRVNIQIGKQNLFRIGGGAGYDTNADLNINFIEVYGD